MPKRRHRPATRPPPTTGLEPRVLFAAYVGSTAYATIQAAVNAAPAGGTVTVTAGTYAEQVTVAQPLTIRGPQAGVDARTTGRPTATAATEAVVTGASTTGGRSSAFHVLANDVTIDGFTVASETSQDDQLGAGIVIGPGQSGTHVVNDVVRDNVSGLFLANASSTDAALVQHDYFADNNNDGDNGGRGVYTDGTISGGNLTDVTIDADTFVDNHGGDGTTGLEAALAFEAGNPGEQSAIRITNDTFTDNGKAVLFFNATDVLIQDNTVTGCQDQYSGSLRFEGHVDHVQILNNTIDANTGPGVAVDSKGMPGDNYDFTVNDNNFEGNNAAYAVPISVVNNFDTYDGSFDARYNYWGSASGPSGYGTGTGDAVGGGYMQIGTGLGWTLTAGGAMLYAPFATAPVPAAATVPAAPSNLTATATSATTVGLSWTDNAAGTETGFTVQRSADGGTTFATVGTTAAGVTTYADAAGLSPATAYAYRVLAVNATGTSAPSNTATVTTPTPTGTTYLSTLAWTSATAGWGTVQRNLSIKGNPITLRGTVYPSGLGTHAASTITYALAGAYATFAADVGVDDETAGQGAVDFQVVGDGITLYDSGVLTGTSPVAHVAVGVAGVRTLQLIATNGVAGTINYDHADWAAARLAAAAVPTAPSALAATATSTSTVRLTWSPATGQTAYAVDRSADGGTTWTTVATPTATTYADVSLSPGTTYTYRVRATNAAGTSAASNLAAVTTFAVAVVTPVSLTTLTPTSATVGWGTMQVDASIKGNPITIRGVRYAAGLGVHASSTVTYALAGRYTTFTAVVGIDDETAGQGSVRFQVLGDGTTLFDSGVLTGTSPAAHLSVSLVGVRTLTLLALPGVSGTIDFDHADWAAPLLTPTAAVVTSIPTPPLTPLTRSAATSPPVPPSAAAAPTKPAAAEATATVTSTAAVMVLARPARPTSPDGGPALTDPLTRSPVAAAPQGTAVQPAI